MEDTIKLKFKFWLENAEGEGILGDGKMELLKLIRDEGSLTAAVNKMGYSYRKTWNKLKQVEKKLGFKIIETSRGGAEGGSSVLTEKGIKLVTAFDLLHCQLDEVFISAANKFKSAVE